MRRLSRRLVAVVAAQIGFAAEALFLRQRSGGAPADPFKRAAESLEKLMDATREELPNTMAAVRLSGMEISDLTMELSDNGSDSELFCFRSRELVEVTKSSKDLRHSVPAVLEVEVEVDPSATHVPNLQPISQWKAFPPPSTEEAHEKIIQSRRLVAVVAAQIGVAAEALLLRRRSVGAPAGVCQGRDGAIRGERGAIPTLSDSIDSKIRTQMISTISDSTIPQPSSSIRNQYLRCYLMDSSSYSESTLTNGEGYVIPICNAELRPYEGLVVVLLLFQYVVCNRQGFHTVDPLDVDVSISEDVNVSDDDEKSEPSLKKSEPPLMWNADSLRSTLQPIQLQSVLQPEPLSLSSIIKSLISIPDNRKTAMVSDSSSLVASISFSSDSATLLKAFNAEKQWISFPRIATGTEKPLTSRAGIAAQKSQVAETVVSKSTPN
ncbi:hypothetical protein SASPL_143121 [Salvia splendens]|uniref:Hs1pro-1 C-terminal domain-containing protein n=1 Tax=Salvia splendens TaxID=180675 RepID=A0A8X8WN83_SALSN|nr:hypothetical protein SASPL_143121 [Salvia splendens]